MRLSQPSPRTLRDKTLQVALQQLHADHGPRPPGRGIYGSPRLMVEARKAGLAIGRHPTARLMRMAGLTGRSWRRRPRAKSPTQAVPAIPNGLMRSVNQLTPNRVWVTDITYLHTRHGTLYLAVVLDLFSRRVVGHAIADHMRTELPLE